MATWEDRFFRARNTAGISVGEAALRRGKQVHCALTGRGGRQTEIADPQVREPKCPPLVQAAGLGAQARKPASPAECERASWVAVAVESYSLS